MTPETSCHDAKKPRFLLNLSQLHDYMTQNLLNLGRESARPVQVADYAHVVSHDTRNSNLASYMTA
jgi:hypothetical protein